MSFEKTSWEDCEFIEVDTFWNGGTTVLRRYLESVPEGREFWENDECVYLRDEVLKMNPRPFCQDEGELVRENSYQMPSRKTNVVKDSFKHFSEVDRMMRDAFQTTEKSDSEVREELERIRCLHVPMKIEHQDSPVCAECFTLYPCNTARIMGLDVEGLTDRERTAYAKRRKD